MFRIDHTTRPGHLIPECWREAPSHTFQGRAFLVACNLSAYVDPSPGQRSAFERDAVAIDIATRWTEKHGDVAKSCAWHEIADHQGTKCHCAPCASARDAERKARA